ncbi:hypothetical protein ACFQZ4_02900 [Catellatospora coxensis]
MHEARDRQQRQHQGGEVGDQRGLARLDAELAESVGGQQQAAQGLALEHGLPLRGDVGQLLLQGGEVRVVVLGRLGDLGAELGLRDAQVGVGPAARGVLQVQADELVGVHLGLLAGGQLLPGVLDQTRLLALLGGEGVQGLERDVLLGELVGDVGAGEVGVGRQHHAGDRQQDGDGHAAEAEHEVEGPALHRRLLGRRGSAPRIPPVTPVTAEFDGPS